MSGLSIPASDRRGRRLAVPGWDGCVNQFDQNITIRKRIIKGNTQKDTAMNIKFIIGNVVDKSTKTVTSKTELVLPLCGQGRPEGSSEGLMPLKLASGVVATPKVAVYSNTSTNRKGAVNAVIKVSMPYTHPLLSEDGQSIVGIDPAKSGGTISMHTVVELPSQAVKALSGAQGQPAAAAGLGQLAVLARLLGALTGERRWSTGYATRTAGEGNTAVLVPASFPQSLRDVGEALDPVTPNPQDRALNPVDDIPGFIGNVGFDISDYKGDRSLNEAISRVVQKLPALGCNDVTSASIIAGRPN